MKEFDRVDVFKQHLVSAHGAEARPGTREIHEDLDSPSVGLFTVWPAAASLKISNASTIT
jgi:hypothetical protein